MYMNIYINSVIKITQFILTINASGIFLTDKIIARWESPHSLKSLEVSIVSTFCLQCSY